MEETGYKTGKELILKLRAPVKTDLWSIFDLRGALGYIALGSCIIRKINPIDKENREDFLP